MRIKLYPLLILFALMFISACSSNDDPQPTTIEHTALIYIMGDNSLSTDGFVREDMAEIIEGAKQVDFSRNNLLVYHDDGSVVKLIRMNKDKKGQVTQEIVQQYDVSRNSVGLDEIKEVLSLVYRRYPAETYGIVLWSHGEGWKPGTSKTRWIGQDGSNTLSISTLNEALKAIPYYEYILFDACNMQSVEVAYELREHTDYFIGSPAEIPGPGAPYEVVVPALFASNDAATTIARSYYEYYSERYNEGVNNDNKNWTGGVAISVIASSKLNALADATKEVLPTYIKNKETIPVSGVLDYDGRSSYSSSYIGYYDFDAFLKNLTGESASYKTWSSVLKEAVPYYKSTEMIYTMHTSVNNGMYPTTGYSGISTYVPRNSASSLNAAYTSFQWYKAAGWNETGW